jgi:hypothetical protein
MLDEDTKRELIASLVSLLSAITFNGETYTIKARRQNQAAKIEYPQVLIAFMNDAPQPPFLASRIGTYTDAEGNEIVLRGWLEKQHIRFEVRAKDDPAHGSAQGSAVVSFIARTVRDFILTNWDIQILGSKGMSVDEPLGPIRYMSEFVGPEYGHCNYFDMNITYNFYWPQLTATPSANVYVETLEIGLREDGDTDPPTYFTIEL